MDPEPDERRAPNPLLWLWFQYGGRLPARHRGWVLHDATTRTWLLRAGLRSVLRLVPVLVVLVVGFRVVVGAQWGPLLGAVALGLLVGLRYAFSNLEESVDARLVAHGFPRGYGVEVRAARNRARDDAARLRYEQRYRRPPP